MNEKAEREAAKIRAELSAAGSVVPSSLRDETFGGDDGDGEAPFLVVESAEGVTTFPGLPEGESDRESAEHWFRDRHREIEENIHPPQADNGGRRGRRGLFTRDR